MTKDDLDELHHHVHVLDKLLTDRQLGMHSWTLMVGTHCEWIGKFVGLADPDIPHPCPFDGGDAE